MSHFLKLHGERNGASQKQISEPAMEALCQYSWPGNVRELENAIQQSIALTEALIIQSGDLPISRSAAQFNSKRGSLKQGKAQAIETFEKEYITELLQAHHGNVTHAALEAKKDRRALGRLIKKYQIVSFLRKSLYKS